MVSPARRRLTDEELFHIGPEGLQEISDRTLELRLDALEREQLRDGATLSQLEPIEAV